jgi:hypothetical protein
MCSNQKKHLNRNFAGIIYGFITRVTRRMILMEKEAESGVEHNNQNPNPNPDKLNCRSMETTTVH